MCVKKVPCKNGYYKCEFNESRCGHIRNVHKAPKLCENVDCVKENVHDSDNDLENEGEKTHQYILIQIF